MKLTTTTLRTVSREIRVLHNPDSKALLLYTIDSNGRLHLADMPTEHKTTGEALREGRKWLYPNID